MCLDCSDQSCNLHLKVEIETLHVLTIISHEGKSVLEPSLLKQTLEELISDKVFSFNVYVDLTALEMKLFYVLSHIY